MAEVGEGNPAASISKVISKQRQREASVMYLTAGREVVANYERGTGGFVRTT